MCKYYSHPINSVKEVFEDMRALKESESSLHDGFVSYLEEKGWPEEYSILLALLKEKHLLLDLVATNRIFGRPQKTKQRILYGRAEHAKNIIMGNDE